jgi:4'-phosphopantetheinyl transferase EntD
MGASSERAFSLNGTSAAVDCLFRGWFGGSVGIAVEPVGRLRDLFPEEEEVIRGAVPSRQAEFSTGRRCARQALCAVGAEAAAIPMGLLREPVWPAGFVGAITHAGGICAAIAAPASRFAGLGIDLVERDSARPLLAEAGRLIASASERDHARSAIPGNDSPALLFSAKESAIKAVSATVGRFLDFTEVQVFFDAERFQASVNGLAPVIPGWWAAVDGLLATGAVCKPGGIR